MEMKKYKLNELCNIYGRIGFRGYTTKDLVGDENDGAITLSPTNIIDGEIDYSNNTYLNWDKYYESPEIILEENNVVLVKTGSSLGKTALVRKIVHPTTLNPQFVVLKNIKANPVYFSYLLKSEFFQKNINAIKVGSAIPTLSQEDLGSIKVFLPNNEIQDKIASVLSALDDKIALNRHMNAKLEQMAKRLYDHWFVQFDFPNTDGKPYKSSGGKMEYNEILKREIPQGWEVKKIDNFCRIFTGKKDVNQSLNSGKYKFYSCAPGYKFSDEKIFEGKAILISGNGSYTGRTIFVNEAFDLYQRTYAVVLKDNLTNWLEYIFFTVQRFLAPKVGGGTHGSAIPYIVYDDIAKESFAFSEEIVAEFEKIIIPILSEIVAKEKEIQKLTALRDKLLPLLMNGQVEVE